MKQHLRNPGSEPDEQGVGCSIFVTVRLPARRCGETSHWQPDAYTPLSNEGYEKWMCANDP